MIVQRFTRFLGKTYEVLSNPEAFLGHFKECIEILESPRGTKDILRSIKKS